MEPAMTTNKPNVRRYDNMGCPEEICRVDTMCESDDGDYVLYEDYEAALADAIKVDHAYLHRISKGEMENPTQIVLKKMGLL